VEGNLRKRTSRTFKRMRNQAKNRGIKTTGKERRWKKGDVGENEGREEERKEWRKRRLNMRLDVKVCVCVCVLGGDIW